MKDEFDDMAAWMKNMYPYIIKLLEYTIHEYGFYCKSSAGDNKVITIVYRDKERMRQLAIIDVVKLMVEAATDFDSRFDKKLSNKTYEILKVKKAVENRVKAVKMLIDNNIDGMVELSKYENVDFKIIKSI